MRGRVWLLAVVCLAAACTTQMASAAPVAKDVQPFKTIRVCQPFNVLVSPSSQANQYQIVLEADDSVGRALQASVADGVLSLGVSGRFSTPNPIKLTVKCGPCLYRKCNLVELLVPPGSCPPGMHA